MKIKILITVAIIILGAAAFSPLSIYAWNNADHPFVVDQAAQILEKDFSVLLADYPDFQQYIDDYLPKIKEGSSDADIFSTTVSDKVITIRFFGQKYTVYMPTSEHYYDFGSQKGAFRYFRSARQKAEEYYNTAKQKFSKNEYDDAFLFLGRAIHLVQDVTIPHHTEIGVKALLNQEGFANWLSGHRSEYLVTSGGIYNEENIGTLVHNNAKTCNKLFDYVDGLTPKWYWPFGKKDDYGKVAGSCFTRAQKTTAGVIAMFLRDVLPEPEPVKQIKTNNQIQELD